MTPDADPTPGEAARRLRVNETRTILAGRAMTAVQLLTTLPLLGERVRHRRVLRTGIAAVVGQTLWAGRRSVRDRHVQDRAAGWSDALAITGALAVEALSWGTRDLPPDPRWSLPFGVVVSAWLPFELEGDALTAAALGWAAVYLASTRNRSPSRPTGRVAGQRAGEALAVPSCAHYSRRFAQHLRQQASQLDDARADAVAQSARLAAERERNHQHRLAHDAAVQVLEAVAGGWEVDDATLLARVDVELDRLERALAGRLAPAPFSLDDALATVAVELGLVGLQVEVVTDAGPPTAPAPVVTALADAAREALTNVAKHGGVDRARVEVTNGQHRSVEVRVIDRGRGFDPGAHRRGFGLDESVRGRVEAVGGHVEIHSAPGQGTTVVLRVPGTDPERSG